MAARETHRAKDAGRCASLRFAALRCASLRAVQRGQARAGFASREVHGTDANCLIQGETGQSRNTQQSGHGLSHNTQQVERRFTSVQDSFQFKNSVRNSESRIFRSATYRGTERRPLRWLAAADTCTAKLVAAAALHSRQAAKGPCWDGPRDAVPWMAATRERMSAAAAAM